MSSQPPPNLPVTSNQLPPVPTSDGSTQELSDRAQLTRNSLLTLLQNTNGPDKSENAAQKLVQAINNLPNLPRDVTPVRDTVEELIRVLETAHASLNDTLRTCLAGVEELSTTLRSRLEGLAPLGSVDNSEMPFGHQNRPTSTPFDVLHSLEPLEAQGLRTISPGQALALEHPADQQGSGQGSSLDLNLLALPDDVILNIFLTLDLLSIMALRQTCRRCFRLSKTPSLWIRMAKWITTLHPNILATLGKPITSYSSEEVEALVTQAVRVERGWSRTWASPPQPSSSFNPEHSWACALCPGGRWFIAGTADRSGRVLYYDLENPELDGQTLLTFDGLDGADARELALQTVQTSGEPLFELAVVFGTAARYTRPDVDKRVMTLWRVTIDSLPPGLSSHLWHTMDVYQNAARRERSLSLAHEHIARLSMHRSGATIVSLYRLSQPMPVVPDVLMLTTKLEDSQGVCIVHDQRILACFDTRIGLYPQPTLPWRGSGPLPQGLSEAKPQWIYSLQTAYEGWLMGMSTPWYNGEGILSISIFDGVGLHILSLEKDGLGIPHVQTLPLEQQSPKAQICLGTFRGLQSTWKSQGLERMTIMDASGLAALRYFAGVGDGTFSRRADHAVVDLNPCPTTSPSTNEYCHVDEQSGIILFPIRGWSPLYHVFRLAE